MHHTDIKERRITMFALIGAILIAVAEITEILNDN